MSLLFFACSSPPQYDCLIRGGTLYDGNGGEPYVTDVAIRGDTVAAIGSLHRAAGLLEIDATGLAVAPGFINMLSWATESLLEDGLSQSDIRQGVTLEVFGEGWSEGPLSDEMRREVRDKQGDIHYEVAWTTLGEYLDQLVARGVSPNVASFVGATTVRIHQIGYEDRPPTPAELDSMKALVAQAMGEGALGLSSALIYPPGSYAKMDELIELAKVAAEYGGMYISHIRSEGNWLLQSVKELLTIARAAKIRSEIYHLKAAGEPNWKRLDQVIEMVEEAQGYGLDITADMYLYEAGWTGLDATMPPWVQEGGHDAWVKRLRDPAIREQVSREIRAPTKMWENFYIAAGSPENILLVGFKNDRLRELTGKTVAEASRLRGTSPEETIIDLVIEDDSRVEAVYFLMSEENVRSKITVPWVSFCSDERSVAPEGVFLERNSHPRAYGNFARLLGKYVRDEKLIPLAEAIRRLTSFPAMNLRIKRRGVLKEGYYADVVIFDPDSIRDHATYENPHQYSTGVVHLFVNGEQVLRDGEHTGAKPGRVVRGPGYREPG